MRSIRHRAMTGRPEAGDGPVIIQAVVAERFDGTPDGGILHVFA
jgi:hypothetical protein